MAFTHTCTCSHTWYLDEIETRLLNPNKEYERTVWFGDKKQKQTRKAGYCWCGKELPRFNTEEQTKRLRLVNLLKEADRIGKSKFYLTPLK